jgi:hypothetical protein
LLVKHMLQKVEAWKKGATWGIEDS